METRTLGRTGLTVSRLGIGLAEIGFGLTLNDTDQAGRVLNMALDQGITFLDTAECYDVSEELVGRTVAHRRDAFVLATKAGHVSGGYAGEDWTVATLRDSIDRSLVRLRTDHVDLLQLHSCEVDVLERGDAIRVLQDARQAGKTRFIGYSGDNEAAAWAVSSGLFDTLQTSFNVVDQRARLRLFDRADARGMGIIAKRPIANGAWGAPKAPSEYSADYHQRGQAMLALGALPDAGLDRIALALAFTLAHDAVDTAIVGTRNPQHAADNIARVQRGLAIAPALLRELHRRFDQLDRDWVQLG
jgi:aryl-alcohol dehydrogenase-like predicted oxidoreductase